MTYFTIGRKIDPRYKTNLWILLMTAGVLVGSLLWTGDWGTSLVFAVGFFLSWAIARELDPLHEYSAFVVGIFYLLMGFGFQSLALGVVFFVLLLLRIITQTTGKEPTALDLAGILGLSLYLILTQGNGIYGIIFIIPMIMGLRKNKKNRVFLIFLVLGILFSAGGIIYYGIFFRDSLFIESSGLLTILVLGLVAGLVYEHFLKKDKGIQDDRGKPIGNRSIRRAQRFFLGTYTLLIVGGDLTIGTYYLFFAVILGLLSYRVVLRIGR